MATRREIGYGLASGELWTDRQGQFMDIGESKEGAVFVLEPKGRLDSANARSFEERVLAAVEQGETALLIDFGGLDYISSAGLRVLLMGAKRLQQSGGTIALCTLSPSIREVFEISGFLTIFTVHDDRATALAAMG